jgi:hypothetical protein
MKTQCKTCGKPTNTRKKKYHNIDYCSAKCKQRLDKNKTTTKMVANKVLSQIVNVCVHCGKDNSKIICQRCNVMTYCSNECMKKHWPLHSLSCQKATKEDVVRRGTSIIENMFNTAERTKGARLTGCEKEELIRNLMVQCVKFFKEEQSKQQEKLAIVKNERLKKFVLDQNSGETLDLSNLDQDMKNMSLYFD